MTATALLTDALRKLGADVRPYIPDRVDEGYGLNSPALARLAEEGVKVVVTVDCGIRSLKEVEDANSYGLDMIISDHHSVGRELPNAYAVINPKQPGCPYPEKMLAGVGIAYKIAEALYAEGVRRKQKGLDEWHPADWLDLVAIGTVADIAPLVGENRVLVKRGLARLNRPQRPGLLALYQEAKLRPGQINAMTIGFGIGPRINAAGRLDSAMVAYNLLTAPDPMRAMKYAERLNALNRLRQEKTRAMQEIAGAPSPATRRTSRCCSRRTPSSSRASRAGRQPPHRAVLPPLRRRSGRRGGEPRLLPQHPGIQHHRGVGPVRRPAGAVRRARGGGGLHRAQREYRGAPRRPVGHRGGGAGRQGTVPPAHHRR